RRAALGVIRIISENGLSLHLRPLIERATDVFVLASRALADHVKSATFAADDGRLQILPLRAHLEGNSVVKRMFGMQALDKLDWADEEVGRSYSNAFL